MDQEPEPPLISILCLIAIITLLVLSVVISRNPKEVEHYEYKPTEQSIVYQWESPVLHFQVLACKSDSLIDRLIMCESGGNPYAINEHDPITRSVGILQFKDLTYKHFCVEQYGFPNEIWNPTYQVDCAKKMIANGFGKHWSCYK